MELSLNSLTKQYDALTAVKDLNLTMTSGVYGLLPVQRRACVHDRGDFGH